MTTDNINSGIEVCKYAPAELLRVLADERYITEEDVLLHKTEKLCFFLNYFDPKKGGHTANTIVVEHTYMSQSFQRDYANFYASVFHPYERDCKRIHFFEASFQQDRFMQAVLEPSADDEEIWRSYLGYIVIRPLARSLIGATILKPYPENGTGRRYPVTRKYKVNLCGKKLRIKSLVFQEQDAVVGSCSSSALWMAFHKTSMKGVFQSRLPSPSEITKSVHSPISEFSGRIFPNEQFTLQQILEAIHAAGLESELINSNQIRQLHYFKAVLYAYVRMGLPVLLLLSIGQDNPSDSNRPHHLVTVTGYRLKGDTSGSDSSGSPSPNIRKTGEQPGPPSLVSDSMDKFYVHDDQSGPFCRIEFIYAKRGKNFSLKTGWHQYDEKQQKLFNDGNFEGIWNLVKNNSDILTEEGQVSNVIIPVSRDIRVQYGTIADPVYVLDQLIRDFFKSRFTWDIYLERSNHHKKKIFNERDYPRVRKEAILLQSLPKYIWVARAYDGAELKLELIFDATNVKEADIIQSLSVFEADLKKKLKEYLEKGGKVIKEQLASQFGRGFFLLLQQAVGAQAGTSQKQIWS